MQLWIAGYGAASVVLGACAGAASGEILSIDGRAGSGVLYGGVTAAVAIIARRVTKFCFNDPAGDTPYNLLVKQCACDYFIGVGISMAVAIFVDKELPFETACKFQGMNLALIAAVCMIGLSVYKGWNKCRGSESVSIEEILEKGEFSHFPAMPNLAKKT